MARPPAPPGHAYTTDPRTGEKVLIPSKPGVVGRIGGGPGFQLPTDQPGGGTTVIGSGDSQPSETTQPTKPEDVQVGVSPGVAEKLGAVSKQEAQETREHGAFYMITPRQARQTVEAREEVRKGGIPVSPGVAYKAGLISPEERDEAVRQDSFFIVPQEVRENMRSNAERDFGIPEIGTGEQKRDLETTQIGRIESEREERIRGFGLDIKEGESGWSAELKGAAGAFISIPYGVASLVPSTSLVVKESTKRISEDPYKTFFEPPSEKFDLTGYYSQPGTIGATAAMLATSFVPGLRGIRIKTQSPKAGPFVTPSIAETGEVIGVKAGVRIPMEKGMAVEISEVMTPRGTPSVREYAGIIERGEPAPIKGTAPVFERIVTGGADIADIGAGTSIKMQGRIIPKAGERFIFEKREYVEPGILGFGTRMIRGTMGRGEASMTKEISMPFAFERVPKAEVPLNLQKIGFRSSEIFLSRVEGKALIKEMPSTEEIRTASARSLIEPVKVGEKTIGFKLKGGTEQLDVFRKGFVFDDPKFQSLVERFPDRMIREELGLGEFRKGKVGVKSFLIEKDLLAGRRLKSLEKAGGTMKFRTAQTFRYVEPEKGFKADVIKLSPEESSVMKDLKFAKEFRNLEETARVQDMPRMKMVPQRFTQRMDSQLSFPREFSAIPSFPATGLGTVPLGMGKTSQRETSKSIDRAVSRFSEISLERMIPKTRELPIEKLSPRETVSPKLSISPTLSTRPIERLSATPQMKETLKPIPIPKLQAKPITRTPFRFPPIFNLKFRESFRTKFTNPFRGISRTFRFTPTLLGLGMERRGKMIVGPLRRLGRMGRELTFSGAEVRLPVTRTFTSKDAQNLLFGSPRKLRRKAGKRKR